MTDLNHVILIGRLTKDISSDEKAFAYLPSGQARANVSIAVNRSRKNGDQWVDEVNYFDITIWGKTAENLKPYLLKGKQIAVDGYLKQDRWEKDGQKFSKVNVQANNVQLLGGKSDGGQQTGGAPRFQPRNNGIVESPVQQSGSYNQDASYGAPTDSSEFPEDIPF
jgi:single-strand DNA-binding protein